MAKQKIVLIEDDEILSKVMHAELTEAGFEVIQTFDGEEGLAAVREHKPDLVLLDLLLPKKHGMEVLEELKDYPDTESVPVIIISQLDSDENIKKGLSLGAADYFVKSQHPVAELIEKVQTYLAQAHHPAKKRGSSE